MKHLKYFNEKVNEGFGTIFTILVVGFLVYRFLKGVFSNRNLSNTLINNILTSLREREKDKVAIIEYDDRYFIRFTLKSGELYDIRILKKNKKLIAGNSEASVFLTNREFDEFLNLIKK